MVVAFEICTFKKTLRLTAKYMSNFVSVPWTLIKYTYNQYS